MAYIPTTWKDGDIITANLLNHLESGVQSVESIKPKCVSVNLIVSNWTSNEPYTQTVTVTGITATNAIILSPVAESWDAAGKAGVYCSTQAENSLTFTCLKRPDIDIVYNVMIQEVE